MQRPLAAADYLKGIRAASGRPHGQTVRRAHLSPLFCRAALLAAIGLLWAGSASETRGAPATDRQVKAAFVINFVKFVEWPDSFLPPAPAPFVVAVLGDDEFGTVLVAAAKGQPSTGRPISVRAVSRPEDLRTAHLVFIGGTEERRLAAILRGLEGTPVLTVGDTHGFAEAGVVLNLYTFDQRVRIEVNTTAAARAQLRLSAHLLRIARIVG